MVLLKPIFGNSYCPNIAQRQIVKRGTRSRTACACAFGVLVSTYATNAGKLCSTLGGKWLESPAGKSSALIQNCLIR